MSEMHGGKRKTGGDISRNVKVPKKTADAKPFSSSRPRSDDKQANSSSPACQERKGNNVDSKMSSLVPSASHDSVRKSLNYGNVAVVKRRLISPKDGERCTSKIEKSGHTSPGNTLTSHRTGLQRTPPHLRKYFLRSPIKTSPKKGASSLTMPVKSPLRRTIKSPGQTSPRRSGHMWRKMPSRNSRDCSPYKLRSPTQMTTTPGKLNTSKYEDLDELNLSSDAGLEHLKLLSEQLSLLNQDSGGLTTAMYYSELRKRTPDKTKRTPGKLWTADKDKTPVRRSRSPPRSLLSTSNESISQGDAVDDDDMWDSCDSVTSDDSTELNIVEPDLDLEAALDTQADKNKLTVLNVKNILHHVITNEHVVAMVRSKLLKEDPTDKSFEPKMTRSKVKEIMETGQMPHPWPISPIKKREKEKPVTIMELSFSDEEDDEYDPQKDPPVCDSEGEDSESFISSTQTSEFGSPSPTTPSTPKLWPALARDDDTPKGRNSTPGQLVFTPQGLMGPPLPPRHLLSNLRSRLNEIPSADDEEDDETIATRTRSKLPLTDTPLDEIESNFVAPDITPDLYDTQCDDQEWGCFLTGLMKTGDPDLNDTLDDEQNDPEYNFLAEEEDDDEDEMRDDRAVKVSKKELNELLDELFEAYGGADILDDDEADDSLTPSYNVPASMKLNESQKAVMMVKVEQEERKIDIMDKLPDEMPVISVTEKAQLDDQLRKHTQLLLQVGVLAADTSGLESPANTCRFLLNELQRFANQSPAGTWSVFNTFNLSSANEAIQSYTREPRGESQSDGNSSLQRRKKVNVRNPTSPEHLDIHQKRWFALCDACIYPRLLPLAKFHPPNILVNDKAMFTDAETNLLALAVREFQHMASYIRVIQYYMMPAKTEEQLKNHIKNKVAKRAPDNPIKQAKLKKIRPTFPCTIDPFDVNYPKLPIDHPKELVPRWLQKMKKLSEWKNVRKERQYARKKQQRLDKKREMNISNVELTDNVREHLKKKKKEVSLSPGVRTRCMSKKDSIKSTVLAKITTRGARKKLSETFGTSYYDIELTQDVPSASHGSSSLECNENLDELESPRDESGSIRNNSGSISEASMASLVSSSDFDSDSDSDKKESSMSRSKPTSTDSTSKCERPHRKIQPAGGNTFLNLPLITVCVNPLGPPLASEAETSHAQQVAHNPIPKAVQPILAYMQAADADPPIAPVRQAVMPAAEAAQPKVPDIAIASGSNENVPITVSISCPYGSIHEPKSNGTPPRLIVSSSAQAILVCSPARSIPGSATKSNNSHSPSPPSFSSPSITSSPSVIFTSGYHSLSGFVTPNKKYPLIAPKSLSGHSENKVSPFIDKAGLKYRARPSPKIKRRLVNRSIQPKGIIINTFISPAKSPTKKAADSIKARLRRKPRPILPKLQLQLLPESTRSTMVTPPPEGFSGEDCTSDEDGEPISSPVVDETSDFLDSENDDNEEEAEDGHLAELMAASTTISTKRPRKNPLLEKRALTDAVFASNIVEMDPLRDDRDTAFARAYLTRVKQAMKNDQESFERFVQILAEFGKDGEKSPVQLYREVSKLLKPYPDLLPDFATFLSPGEALECGCATDAEDFHRARAFLRKLEVHFQKHPNFFHKIVKALDMCRNGATEKLRNLQEMMKSLLRGQPHLIEEFMAFFPEDKPPTSHMTDFEELTLEYSDDEPTPYENVKVPDKETTYGTSRCCCNCHGTSGAMKRKTHCRKCALTIIDGQLCLMTKNRGQGGATTVVFHGQPGQDLDDDSRQSGPSRRASLDSLGPELSDIENILDGASEPHRRQRVHKNHKVLAELTDSSDQASNDTIEPGYYGLDNLPRNNISGSPDEEDGSPDEEDDDDDVDIDDLDDEEDEDDLADDEDENNDDKEDLDEDEGVADDLDDIDDSDDNMDLNVDSDDEDEDDDFDPSAYIEEEEEENEENQSSEAVESPESSRIESTLIEDENSRVSNDANSNGASKTIELRVDNLLGNSGMIVGGIKSRSDVSIVDEMSDESEPEGAKLPKKCVQPDGIVNLKGDESSLSSGSDVADDGNRHSRQNLMKDVNCSNWTRYPNDSINSLRKLHQKLAIDSSVIKL